MGISFDGLAYTQLYSICGLSYLLGLGPQSTLFSRPVKGSASLVIHVQEIPFNTVKGVINAL